MALKMITILAIQYCLPWATPVVSGHLPCTATLSMSRHNSTLNYLRPADTCLTRTQTLIYWLSVPAITDSVNKCRVFGGHFNPKSLAHSNFDSSLNISVLPSDDHKQYFLSRVYACVMNHVISASQPLRPFVTFVLRHHIVKVTSSVFKPHC